MVRFALRALAGFALAAGAAAAPLPAGTSREASAALFGKPRR